MPDKKISQLDPGGSLLRDDLFVIAREDSNKKITMDDVNIIDIDYNDLVNLRDDEELIRGQWYYITDTFVYVRASASNELFKDAFFRKHCPSKGSISVTSGTGGSVNSITVDGVDILGTPVPFTTDLETLVAELAALINNYVSSPDYMAVARGQVLDIYSFPSDGIASNGFAVSGTVSGGDLVLDNAEDMSSGKESLLPGKYDLDNNEFTGIETMGFTDTEVFEDQVGIAGGGTIFSKEFDKEQKILLEGTLEGFLENYDSGYTTKIFISCWKSSTDAYALETQIKLSTIPSGNSNHSIVMAINGGRPAMGEIKEVFTGDMEINASGTAVEIDTNYNGWGLSVAISEDGIELEVSSRVSYTTYWGYEVQLAAISDNDATVEMSVSNGETTEDPVLSRNWMFTYSTKTLINNF